jgi:uncharacterized protein
MYLVFAVRPFTRSLPRAILKPPKVYFYDNGDPLVDESARFENLVAVSLLKRLQFLEDRDGYRYELRYLRDKEGREVDFVVLKENQVEELIEVKWADETISKALLYYSKRLQPTKATQLVARLKRPFDHGNIQVRDPFSYFNSSIYTPPES